MVTLNRVDDAEKCFDAGIAVDPDYPKFYLGKSNAAAMRGDFQSARRFLSMALAKDPNYQPAQIALRHLDEPLQQFIQAFIGRDFATCMEQGFSLLHSEPSHQLLMILIVTLQRLGRNDILDQLVPQVLESTTENPWQNGLYRLLLGEMQAADLLATSQNEEQRCQAHFYCGSCGSFLVGLRCGENSKHALGAFLSDPHSMRYGADTDTVDHRASSSDRDR